MKNLKAPFLAFVLLLLNMPVVSAYNHPPPPSKSMARLANDDSTNGIDDVGDGEGGGDTDGTNDSGGGGIGIGPGSGPGDRMPIDQNIMILLIGGLALGATVIYRKQTKKASN